MPIIVFLALYKQIFGSLAVPEPTSDIVVYERVLPSI
jgi:hypothetical protein